jgi:ribose transport system permease protein
MRQKTTILPITFLVCEIGFFQSLNSNFLRLENLVAIGDQMALVLPLALAGTFVIMMGSFDLSITSILALSGVTVALSYPTLGLTGIFLGVAVGLVLGITNGLVFVIGQIPSFIVTIGTMVTYQGIALILMNGGQSIQIYTPEFRAVSTSKVGGVDAMIIWSLVILVVSYYVLSRTKFGRQTYAVGANIEAARKAGIDIRRQRILSFAISGVICGLAGVIYVTYSSQASPGMGSNLLLPAVAAMVVGGNPITGGVGGAHRTFLGAIILSVLSNGLIILVIPINIQTIIYGVVVVLTIAATLDRERVKLIR